MADQWFIVPRIGSGDLLDEYRPKYEERVEGFAGRSIPDKDLYIARFYGSQSTLDAIAAKDDADPISNDTMRDRLNDITGKDYTIEQWLESFNIG